MKNNYILFWSDWDLYTQSFADLQGLSNTRYINSPTMYMSKIKASIYNEIHKHPRINKILGKYFKELWVKPEYWYSSYYKDDFNNNNEKVFIFSRTWIQGEFEKYIDFLKNQYPNSHYVLVLFDLCKKNGGLNIEWAKRNFDIILSFDHGDCEKYNFIYYPLVFSKFYGEINKDTHTDVFFCGQPKDRFKEIISCLEKLWENEVKTDVHLIWVDPKEQVYKNKITYHDNVIPYRENLNYFLNSNCILEIMQGGGLGYTQRMCEAIAFDKKIITNNPLIHNAPFYNPEFILQINNANDITPELCKKIKKTESVDYQYKEQLSPIKLLDFIENKLLEL